MGRKAKETQENFEAGRADAFSVGDYGRTVRVYADGGKLWIRYRRPNGRRTPVQLFAADTPALRAKAAKAAVLKAGKLREGHGAEIERTEKTADDLTIWDVALLYMRRAPGFPAECFDPVGRGVAAAVESWHQSLPPAIQKDTTVPKAKSLWSDIYAFRRLFRDPRFARTRRMMTLDPADATNYVKETVAKGGSPRTPVNDTDRLSCAIDYVMTQYRRTYGIPFNPLGGRIVDRTKAEVPEYTAHEVEKLLEAVDRGEPSARQWQVQAAIRIAHSGRRRGAILALSAADHHLERTQDHPFGSVTWQAEHAKGGAYGQGDVTMPMAEEHRKAVDWLLDKHPNPNGASAPLLWKDKDPAEHIGGSAIDQQLRRLEKAAGVSHKRGRAFHGFCRSIITWLADAHGDGVSAEFTGRTVETIRRYSYKKVQGKTMGKAARSLSKPKPKRER